ncbi:MAG TPA: hypothetical protein VGM39_09260 [Kofleriaceae bacterium]|jgi:hypothetical protein
MKLLSASLVLIAGCAMSGSDADPSLEQDSSATTYVQILDFDKIDQGAWYDGIHSLNSQFDDICGDTFCEGDYSNITPLTFACSVSSKAGNVKDCAWTFSASQLDVDPKSAAIVTQAPTFECHFKMKTTATKLATILAGSDSLDAALPGAPADMPSLYDQLGDCFEHPFVQNTGSYATTGKDSYVSSRDYYASAAGQARWSAAQAAAVAGFDNVCGDTFCSSDYNDLQSMNLECAVTKSTGNVKSCAWVFGGSYFWVPNEKTGALVTEHKTFRCDFAVKGTLAQLISTWTATGTEDAIHRPLPGETATAYDALGGCLP